jgi:hypothetical protein
MTDQQQDPFDELMRRSLADEAARIEPADGLGEIRARIRAGREPAGRRGWLLTAGAAVVGTAAAIGVFTMLANDTGTSGSPEAASPVTTTTESAEVLPPTPESSATPSRRAGTPSPGETTMPKAVTGTQETATVRAVPVYWVGRSVGAATPTRMRLYRTFSRIEGRPAYEALRVMTSGEAGDPDYRSLWTGARVTSVSRSDGMVTVDFAKLPPTRLAPEAAALAVQQLVYTVQGVLGDQTPPIRITERGRAGPIVFGVIDTGRPLSRAQAADVQAPVWINSPVNGAVTSRTVVVSGIAAAYEAQIDWRAVNTRTKQVLTGFATTTEGQKFSPYSFPLKLTPGVWEIQVFLQSGEDGRTTDTDSKTVTVK